MYKFESIGTRRKKRNWLLAATITVFSWGTYAADHLDAPETKAEPAADITDVFTWMSSDMKKLNLVLNVSPMASQESKFSNAVQYVFHVNNSTAFGAAQIEKMVICTFDTEQKISCSMDDTMLVTGQMANQHTGVASADGRFKVFAGLRNDPFFFDLTAFNTVVDTVKGAAGSLQFNDAGCPTVPAPVQTTLVKALAGGKNTFARQNVLSIVVQADKELFGAGPIYGVWASTHRAQ